MLKQPEANFEVNLLPVISVLAVCISFLLVTAVWMPLGTFDVKQAIGEKSDSQPADKVNRIQIFIQSQNRLVLDIEQNSVRKAEYKFIDASDDLKELSQYIERIKASSPDLKQVFVHPHSEVEYQKVVKVLEVLNKHELKEIGIQPSL